MNCDTPSLSRYKGAARCRCDGCREANLRYGREYTKTRIVTGNKQTVVADRVREHLGRLREMGIGFRSAAHLAGVSEAHLRRIAAGETRKVNRAIEAALLRITP